MEAADEHHQQWRSDHGGDDPERHRVGYASPSAYVAAFHREIGTTPARYFGTGAGH